MGTIALPRRRPAMHRGVAMILHWLLQKLSAKAFFRSCSSCDVVNPTLQIRRIGRRNAVALSSPMRPITADAPVSDVRHQHQSYTTIFNHCDIIGLKICRILWKKTQNKGYYGVNVIQDHRGRYQSKARMRFAISD